MKSISQDANDALDAAFNKASRKELKRIADISRFANSDIQLLLRDLEREALRLFGAGKNFTPDNKILKKALAGYNKMFEVDQRIIEGIAEEVQNSAIDIARTAILAKIFPGIAGVLGEAENWADPKNMKMYLGVLKDKGVRWNNLSSATAAVNYMDKNAWNERLAQWGIGYSDMTRKLIFQDILNGVGPNAIASHLRQLSTNLPVAASENIMRTLQLTAYRDSSLALEIANGRFIEYKIRIAQLDPRTCLACIGLHGTRLEVGQRVDDHYRGRCTEFYVVPGGKRFPDFMQADSTPGNRRFVPFESGEDWFAKLPKERQIQQASFKGTPAKYAAYLDGVKLKDFAKVHVDSVFGKQVVENSLKKMGLTKYYKRNNTPPKPPSGTPPKTPKPPTSPKKPKEPKYWSTEGNPKYVQNVAKQLAKTDPNKPLHETGFTGTFTSDHASNKQNVEYQKQVSQILQRHDPRMLASLKEIRVITDQMDWLQEMAVLFPKWPTEDLVRIAGVYSPGGNIIRMPAFDGAKINPMFLDHEIGHHVDWASKSSFIWRNEYTQDAKFDRHTKYGLTNEYEGFAETYSVYMSLGPKAANNSKWYSIQLLDSLLRTGAWK